MDSKVRRYSTPDCQELAGEEGKYHEWVLASDYEALEALAAELAEALEGIALAYERRGKDLDHTLWCIWSRAKAALSKWQERK